MRISFVRRGYAGRGGARGRGELQNSCDGDQVCDGYSAVQYLRCRTGSLRLGDSDSRQKVFYSVLSEGVLTVFS